MRSTQALFSATLIILIGLAGLHQGVDIAWKMAIATAALAFFSEQLRQMEQERDQHYARSFNVYSYLGNAATLLSWLTGAVSGVSLLFYA